MHSHLTCAFVGERLSSYRFGFDEEHPDCLKLKFLIATQIYTLVDNGVTTFLTSMELGMDTWGAEMVLQLKKSNPYIRLFAVLPSENQADRWSVSQRENYFRMLGYCDRTIYSKCRHNPENLWLCKKSLIDHASFILAAHNGKPTGELEHIIGYAHKKMRAIITINPDTFDITPFSIGLVLNRS